MGLVFEKVNPMGLIFRKNLILIPQKRIIGLGISFGLSRD